MSLRVFQNGAVVCTYKNKTIVYGVNSNWDESSVSKYLQNNSMPVDFLVTQRSLDKPSLLSNDVSVNTFVCDEFDDVVLVDARYNNLEVQNTYNAVLDENFSFCYNQGDVIIRFNDITVGQMIVAILKFHRQKLLTLTVLSLLMNRTQSFTK